MKNKLIVNCEQLYNNCIYSSVAHAIFVLKAPLFNYTQSWDGINYNFNYGTTRGIITFDLSGQTVTGAARDDTSIRRKWYPVYKAISLFDQAPEKNRLLAHNETLEYLYDEEGGFSKDRTGRKNSRCISVSDRLQRNSRSGGSCAVSGRKNPSVSASGCDGIVLLLDAGGKISER